MLWSIFFFLEMNLSTLIVKKRKINDDTVITMPTINNNHFNINRKIYADLVPTSIEKVNPLKNKNSPINNMSKVNVF